MPLAGFHCPGSPSWDFKTIGDCRKCENVCFGGSLEMVEVVWGETFTDEDHYHNNPKVISVTEVIGCLRQAWYKRVNDYAETPQRLLARVSGTHTHRLLEKHNPHGAEHQIFTPLSRGYSFGGTMDKKLPGVIKDYKTCDNPTKTIGGATRETEDGTKVHLHADQLSIYADLVESVGTEAIDRLEIVQVGRRDAMVHEAYRVPGALDRAIERAELLIDAIEKTYTEDDFLPREGVEIKFYGKANLCGSCPFKVECIGSE